VFDNHEANERHENCFQIQAKVIQKDLKDRLQIGYIADTSVEFYRPK